MDQALKARLIGAVILVGLAVLVIPELLSGRKSEQSAPAADTTASPVSPASRTITIELGPQEGSQRSSAAEGTAAERSVPEPADPAEPQLRQPDAASSPAGTAAVTDSSEKPATASPSVAKPAPDRSMTTDVPASKATEPAAAPKTAAASSQQAVGAGRGTWSVQVGAFGSATAAQKLSTELDGAGFAAYVAPARQGNKSLHRVRVGPVANRAEANQLATRLKSRGLPVTIVAND